MQSIKKMLQGLTHADLLKWAGGKIFKRGKEYVPNVSELSRTDDYTLAAWVFGSDEYATSVRYTEDDGFNYSCTCPYDGWGPCKHAVAVVLAAAEKIGRNEPIPLLDPGDDLYQEILGDSDDWLDEEPADPADPRFQTLKGRALQIESLLAGKTREELLALLIDLALDYPEVSRRLRGAAKIESGQTGQVIHALRKEIRRLTSEDAWYDHWKGKGSLPDYSHVQEQLQALLSAGHADAVLELGEELWEQGSRQVETAHDEGKTAQAIAECLHVVLCALPQSSLPPSEQLLWRIARELEDEFNLLEGAASIDDSAYACEHWEEVAEVLEQWLDEIDREKSTRFSAYSRSTLVTWLLHAYRASSQEHKILPFLEQEAVKSDHYDLLVKTLQESGNYEQARQWCIRGFQIAAAKDSASADRLMKYLRELAVAENRWDLAAAYQAEEFFVRPSKATFSQLRQAAENIDVWSTVRQCALRYLETGQRPTNGNGDSGWPFPEPEVRLPDARHGMRKTFPQREMLLEIALLEERIADAMAIFQELPKRDLAHRMLFERLAEAAASDYPDFALRIWRNTVAWLIGQVKPRAYEEASGYLHRMHKVYARTGREAEWKTYLQSLRKEHKPKWRLMEVLDGLENNRPLIG